MKTSDASPTIPSPPAINRPVVVIYGGMHKTGTSSIQNTLYDNIDLLNAHSVDIIRSGLRTRERDVGIRHYYLSKEIGNEKGLGKIWSEAAQEVEEMKFGMYILMHENFFSPRMSPDVICSAFPKADIRMVVCIRNPIDYILSQYREKIHRVGEFREPSAFIDHNAGYLRTDKIKKRWERKIGSKNVSCVSYEAFQDNLDLVMLGKILDGSSVDIREIRISPRENHGIDDERCLKYFMANKAKKSGLEISSEAIRAIAAVPGVNIGRSTLLSQNNVQQIINICGQGDAIVKKSTSVGLPYNAAFFDESIREGILKGIMQASQTVNSPAETQSEAGAWKKTMAKQAIVGVIRGTDLVVEIQSGDLEKEAIELELIGNSQRIMGFEKTWPDDFEIECHQRGREYRGSLRIPHHHIPSECTKITATGSLSGPLHEGDGWCLYNLCAYNSSDFESKFFRFKRRVSDPETLIFSIKRILNGHYVHQSHRCVASVIFCYKALDLAQPSYIREALDNIVREAQNAYLLEDTDHPRTDKTHIGFSIDIAICHLCISTGDFANLSKTLSAVRKKALLLEKTNTLLCYNICRMLLLGGYLEFLSGNTKTAAEWFKDNFIFYCRSYQNSPMNEIWFRELGEAHHAVLTGLRYLDAISDPQKKVGKDSVFEAFNRVRSETGSAALKASFNNMKSHFKRN